MAKDESISTKDLFLLMIGLYKLKSPPTDAKTGNRYWLKDDSLRETEWNWEWFKDSSAAWNSVKHRDWLVANIAANVTGNSHDFKAISEPLFFSLDVLTNEFKPDMAGATDAINQAVYDEKTGYKRSFLTTLSVGLSQQKVDEKSVTVLGAGMRRRTSIWQPGAATEALQADLEFFVPFYAASGAEDPETELFKGVRSICAGIAITRANGGSIGTDDGDNDLAAVRFNFRIPFTARIVNKNPPQKDIPGAGETVQVSRMITWGPSEIVTSFDPPAIKAEKRRLTKLGEEPLPWETFDDWPEFVTQFCEWPEGSALLNAPVGPLLLEKISDTSGIKDILVWREPSREQKEESEETKKELNEARDLLKGLWNFEWPPQKPDSENAILKSSSERRLGSFLYSLGLLEAKNKGKTFEYSFKKLGNLTVWEVVNRLLNELDGFPLYIKSATKKEPGGARIAVTLASQTAEKDANKQFFGLAGMAYNIAINTAAASDAKKDDSNSPTIILDDDSFTEDDSILIEEDDSSEDGRDDSSLDDESGSGGDGGAPQPEGAKSTIDLRLQLGKWFEGETLDDNWFRRLLPPASVVEKGGWKRRSPLPGIRLFPFKRVYDPEKKSETYSLAPRLDLLSLGVDIKGATKEGLTFLQFGKGPLSYFGLGAIEARMSLLMSEDGVAFGIGVKLKDMRLSFGPKEKSEAKDDDSSDDIFAGIQKLFEEEEKPEKKRGPKTRLGAKKVDTFSISVGYLTPVAPDSPGTLDIQLYDKKGKRGGIVWIPIDRSLYVIYIKQIGIGLKGVENLDLAKGLSEKASLSVALTGGLRLPAFELGFIGAKLTIPFTHPKDIGFELEGLDISLKAGPVVISGSFLKSGYEYGGALTIEFPKVSFSAMGFYGPLCVFSESFSDEVVQALHKGKVHPDLDKKLKEHGIISAFGSAASQGLSGKEWEMRSADGRWYDILLEDGKVTVLSPDKTLFIYGMMSASGGGGIRVGAIEFTALAIGFGWNRRVLTPAIDEVADFPLVKVVMGKGGYRPDETDLSLQMGKPIEAPGAMLQKMKKALPTEKGQYFLCGGVRFTIASAIDCFGLIIVQFGNELEIALIGLARFKYPREAEAAALCYIEMQVLMSLKPSEGTFKLQALLTSNSWIINKDCKLTGGFAIYVWFGGPHKDDFVVTFGGYHPRFRRPSHYPMVPRIGFNWPIADSPLTIKGELYLAVTASCIMFGARLEASFHSGRLSAWFTAYLDVILAWNPVHYEIDIGITLRVEESFAVTAIKLTIGATVQIWGPPVGGIAHVDVVLFSHDFTFGATRDEAKPKPIGSWAQFFRTFFDVGEKEKPADVSYVTRPNLVSGRYNSNSPSEAPRENDVWRVRADELILAGSTAVPVTALNVGTVKTNSPPEGIPARRATGTAMEVEKPVLFDDAKKMHVKKYGSRLGVHPMGKKFDSSLNVTIVRDQGLRTSAVDLTGWIVEAETTSLPAALWDPAKPDPEGPSEPTAKLIRDCITGIKSLKPPAGKRGGAASPTSMRWSRLDEYRVAKSNASQEIPQGIRNSRSVQDEVAAKQADQKTIADALAEAGFGLTWKPPETPARFRDLHAKPMRG
ncbi:MAG: hypothetical protein DMF61_04900 [Blastocatellia bacterium AA13]|nr:MAG: hypothetical protein DMF61_04900 [Blastocatellia bacterium AA13]